MTTFFGLLILAGFVCITIIFIRQEHIMNDFTALKAIVDKTASDVDALLAVAPASDQPTIDALTEQVTAINAKVAAALPPTA